MLKFTETGIIESDNQEELELGNVNHGVFTFNSTGCKYKLNRYTNYFCYEDRLLECYFVRDVMEPYYSVTFIDDMIKKNGMVTRHNPKSYFRNDLWVKESYLQYLRLSKSCKFQYMNNMLALSIYNETKVVYGFINQKNFNYMQTDSLIYKIRHEFFNESTDAFALLNGYINDDNAWDALKDYTEETYSIYVDTFMDIIGEKICCS